MGTSNDRHRMFRIGNEDGPVYFDYDEETQTASPMEGGSATEQVRISADRLADFLHAARMLGVEAEELERVE